MGGWKHRYTMLRDRTSHVNDGYAHIAEKIDMFDGYLCPTFRGG